MTDCLAVIKISLKLPDLTQILFCFLHSALIGFFSFKGLVCHYNQIGQVTQNRPSITWTCTVIIAVY